MKVGIIGAGAIGQAIARQLVHAGLEAILANSRGPDTLREVVEKLGPHAHAGTIREAATADIVVLAVPWMQIETATTGLDFKGRIVIDATNPIIQPGFRIAELGGRTSTQVVAELLPGARIVKAFNTLLANVLASNAQHAGGHRVVFYSGDDAEAKSTVGDLIAKLGFAGIDLGSLELGGRLQQFPGGALPTLNLVKLD